MKCKQCGSEMEIYQTSKRADGVEKRWRCMTCSNENVERVGQVAEKPEKLYLKDKE